MQTKAVTIRTQALDGTWEATGTGRLRGVWPENDSYTADELGPSKASFDLRRDPGSAFPGLMAFTPIEVEIGGQVVWSGRIAETPIREGDRVFNVQAAGWQFHLDDDVYERPYVHTRLGDYKDTRSIAGSSLGANRFFAGGVVVADRGQVQLAFPVGATVTVDSGVGITLDLGQNGLARRIVVQYESSNSAAAILLRARGSTITDPYTAGEDAFAIANNTGVGGVGRGTFTGAYRYVHLFAKLDSGGGVLGSEHWFRIVAARVFAEPQFEAADFSVLQAPTIIDDALDRATILLSPDRSEIDPDGTVTFAFPEFAMDGQHTPREVLTAANAVHDYSLKVDVDRRVVFRPKTASPRVEIGAWPGSVFDDASANSGDEIYNRVVVEGTGEDGQKLSVERTQAQQPGAPFTVLASPAADNPSFATNTATWTPGVLTTITRDTAVFDSGPASGRWERSPSPTAGDLLTETFTGTFRAGIPYQLTVRLRGTGAGSAGIAMRFGVFGVDSAETDIFVTGTVFQSFTVVWTPTVDRVSGVTLRLPIFQTVVPVHTAIYVDSLSLSSAQPTLVDRRGFKRTHILPISNTLTPALGQQIGDVFLAAHKTTPLKGTVQITGDRGARDILTGASVPPERLLTMTTELLRLSHRVDPDDGAQGRDGRIAEVTYTPAADTATVAIDSRRTSQEALLARMAVVVGTGS